MDELIIQGFIYPWNPLRVAQDLSGQGTAMSPAVFQCLPPSYPHNCWLIALPDPPTVCHVTDVRIITITKYTDN